MEFLTGIESTYVFGSGRDLLDTNDHAGRYRADLHLARSLGVRSLRYSIPWHKIEATEGHYDWTWTDRALAEARDLELDVIADLLHHTSFPDWLAGGFLDARFTRSFVRFARAVAARYPHLRRYTVVNEPYVTCWFCAHEGVWHPKATGDEAFAHAMVNVAMATCQAQWSIQGASGSYVEFVHTESCEKHFAAAPESVGHARRMNQLRFAGHDLVLGMVDREHPLWNYFKQCDGGERNLESLCENPGRIDVLGLDYYQHSEIWWSKEGRVMCAPEIQGFADVATDYLDRYGLDCMLAETNLRGTLIERTRWMDIMVEQCRRLEGRAKVRGLKFCGFTWYPAFDCRGWSNLCTRVTHDLDPQGLVSLDDDNERVETEFTRAFRELATKDQLAEIPA